MKEYKFKAFDLQLCAEGDGGDNGGAGGQGDNGGQGQDQGEQNKNLLTVQDGQGGQQEQNTGSQQQNSQENNNQQQQTGAPESYADFAVPEGMTYDKDSAAKFGTIAKELNLTQEQAQKLVDFYGGQIQAIDDTRLAMVEGWYNDSVKQYKPTDIALANRTLSRVAGKEFISLLAETGLSNHPQVIGLFKSIGSQISEGKFVDTQTGSGGNKPLYPNSPGMYK